MPDEIYLNPMYRFQAALFQVNNPNRADVSIKFINNKDISIENQKKLNEMICLINEKKVPVSGLNMFKAGDVANEIQRRLSEHYGVELKFTAQYHHNKCCFHYKCRSKNKSLNETFCVYNETFGKYTYSQKWINYLYKKLSNQDEILELFPQYSKLLLNLLSSSEVSKGIKSELTSFYGKDIKFNNHQHKKCVEKYKCKYKSGNEIILDEKFCVNERDNYYYTQDWFDFLIGELKQKDKFNELFPNQKVS